jgi:hypothetical protein
VLETGTLFIVRFEEMNVLNLWGPLDNYKDLLIAGLGFLMTATDPVSETVGLGFLMIATDLVS